jgi:hypothetical protein
LKYSIDWSYVANRLSWPGAKPHTDSGVGRPDATEETEEAGALATGAFIAGAAGTPDTATGAGPS